MVVGSQSAAISDHLSLFCCAILLAHLHCRCQRIVVHSGISNFLIVSLAMCVALLMKSGHGSVSSSSVIVISCCRSGVDVLLATSSVESSGSSACCGGVAGCVVVVLGVLRRGVPIINRSMRRCVRCISSSKSFVNVQDVQPYIMVGVIVPSKSRSRDLSGYDLLVSSCRSNPNLRQAAAMRLSISVLW